MEILNSKKIVIKIGSSILINESGNLKTNWVDKLIEDVFYLIKKKIQIIIVTSGAIALGCKFLKKNKTKLKLNEFQAVAAVGQIELMNLFKKSFLKKKIKIGQILLTLDDTEFILLEYEDYLKNPKEVLLYLQGEMKMNFDYSNVEPFTNNKIIDTSDCDTKLLEATSDVYVALKKRKVAFKS